MSKTKGITDPQRNARDLYKTPQWCIDALVQQLGNNQDINYIVDIGAGDGRIGKSVQKVCEHSIVKYIDINVDELGLIPRTDRIYKMDYAQFDVIYDFDYCTTGLFVSNPPFSCADDFVTKTVDAIKSDHTRPHMAIFLLRLNWLGSKKRASWINKNPPTRITGLAPRPSFCKRKTVRPDGSIKVSSTDACEYAWFWWENQRAPGPFVTVGLRD